MAMEVMRRPLAGADLAREVLPLRTMMDRLLDTAFAPSAWGGWNGAGAAGFGADVYETDSGYTIQCLLQQSLQLNDCFRSCGIGDRGEQQRFHFKGRRLHLLLQQAGFI